MNRERMPGVHLRRPVRVEWWQGHGWVLRTVENGLMKHVYRTRRQARAAAHKYREANVTSPCGCELCDAGLEIRMDAYGPHHIIRGRRRSCSRKQQSVDNLALTKQMY